MEKLEAFKLSLRQLVSNECAKAPESTPDYTNPKSILDRVEVLTNKVAVEAKAPLAKGELILTQFKFEKEGLGFRFDWGFKGDKIRGTNEGAGFVFLEGGGGGPRRIRITGTTHEECIEKAVYELSYAIMWEIAHN